jgi:hypothetical protein
MLVIFIIIAIPSAWILAFAENFIVSSPSGEMTRICAVNDYC